MARWNLDRRNFRLLVRLWLCIFWMIWIRRWRRLKLRWLLMRGMVIGRSEILHCVGIFCAPQNIWAIRLKSGDRKLLSLGLPLRRRRLRATTDLKDERAPNLRREENWKRGGGSAPALAA